MRLPRPSLGDLEPLILTSPLHFNPHIHRDLTRLWITSLSSVHSPSHPSSSIFNHPDRGLLTQGSAHRPEPRTADIDHNTAGAAGSQRRRGLIMPHSTANGQGRRRQIKAEAGSPDHTSSNVANPPTVSDTANVSSSNIYEASSVGGDTNSINEPYRKGRSDARKSKSSFLRSHKRSLS